MALGQESKLKVVISADAKKLNTAIGTAQGKLKGFGNSIVQNNKAIGMAMTAMGGAIVAMGLMSVKSFAKMGDEVQKMAFRTGFATETLSELRHVAELSGASLESIDKATKRMSKTIVDADEGMATYIRAFERIGLSAEELIALSPEEQFWKIASAIGDLEDHALKAATAQDIFGRAGTQLLPMLAAGTDGIAAMRQEAHDLGIVFDQEAANKAAMFNDALTKLKGGIEGAKMGIAETLIPVLMPLIEKVVEITGRIRDWMQAHPQLTKVITIVAGAVGGLLLVLGPLLIMLPGLIALLPMLGMAFHAALGPIGLITLAITGLIAIGVLLWKNWDQLKRDTFYTWNLIRDFFIGLWQNIVDIFTEHWRIILAVLFPAVGIPLLIAQHWNTIVAYFSSLWATVTNIFSGIANSMWEPIKNAIQWIINYINTLIQTIRNLWGMFGGGGGGGDGVGAKFAKAIEPYEEVGFVPFQHGGIVRKPTLAMVGEAGPEAIVPLRKGMGGITVNFYEPVFMEREESMNKLAEKIERLISRNQRLNFGRAYSG